MAAQSSVAQELVYNSKPGAAPAAVVRVNTPPFNKDNFSRGNETISINIPSGKRGQYLDPSMSYLKFQLEVELKEGVTPGEWTRATELTAKSVPIIALDGGAHALFTSLEVSHGSNVLEQIREYNALYQLLMDQGEDFDGYKGGRTLAEGVSPISGHYERGGVVVTDVQLPHAAFHKIVTAQNGVVGPFYVRPEYTVDISNSSKTKSTNLNTAIVAGEQDRLAHVKGVVSLPNFEKPRRRTFTFCMPIVSGILGTGMPKYVPVGILNSDLRLEFGLGPWEQAFKCVGRMYSNKVHVDPDACWEAGGKRVDDYYKINITNVELVADYIELAADVQLAIESQHNGSYFMSYDSYQNFQQPLPAGAGNMSALIGAKVSSMKTIYTIFRDQHTINSLRGSQVTSRLNPFSSMPPRPEFKTANRDLSDTQWNNGTGYYYSIGATHYPPTDVRSDPESYYEALKARHNLLMRHSTGLITPRGWNISARVDNRYDTGNASNKDLSLAPERWYHAPQQEGTFFLGMNFESQAHRSDYSNSGVSTLAQSMYLIARFPNVVDDFGEPVYLQTSRIGIDPDTASAKLLETATTVSIKNLAIQVNANSFPGAVMPKSVLDKTNAGDALLVTGISADDDKKVYADATTFKKNYQEVSYKSQQGAMVVDHWVHYDGFMVVEMGEVKTRW